MQFWWRFISYRINFDKKRRYAAIQCIQARATSWTCLEPWLSLVLQIWQWLSLVAKDKIKTSVYITGHCIVWRTNCSRCLCHRRWRWCAWAGQPECQTWLAHSLTFCRPLISRPCGCMFWNVETAICQQPAFGKQHTGRHRAAWLY